MQNHKNFNDRALNDKEIYRFDVSVIIPCYNRANVLQRSVEIALRQTGIAVEVVVVNDGSTDDTLEKLEEYSGDWGGNSLRIESYTTNHGQSYARNLGISVASGEFIALLDSDDTFENEHVLANWVKLARKQDAEICVSRVLISDTLKSIRKSTRPWPQTVAPKPFSQLPILVFARSCWQCLFRADFLKKTGVQFSPNLRQREDRLFMVQAFMKADRISLSNNITHVHFRDQVNSTMKDRSPQQLDYYITHMLELSASFDEVRSTHDPIIDFEIANSFLYHRNIVNYWRPTVLELYSSEHGKIQIRQLMKALNGLAAHLPRFSEAEKSNFGFLSEIANNDNEISRLDVVRAAAQLGDIGIFRRMVKRKPLHQKQLDRMKLKISGFDDFSAKYLVASNAD